MLFYFHFISQFKFRIPPYYTLLVRSLTVLEGIALASDPNYKASARLLIHPDNKYY